MPNLRLTGSWAIALISVSILIIAIAVIPNRPANDRQSAIYAARYAEAEKYVAKVLENDLKRFIVVARDLMSAFRNEHPNASAVQIAQANAIMDARTAEIVDAMTTEPRHVHATYFGRDDLRFRRHRHPDVPIRLRSARIGLTTITYESELDRALADRSWHSSRDTMLLEIKHVFEQAA